MPKGDEKWLLASISKGRDVSDFFTPHVVKLVGATSLEVRNTDTLSLANIHEDHWARDDTGGGQR